MGKRIRAKAGLPWPATGTFVCDKCHALHTGNMGVIAPRCLAPRGDLRACNCAYFALSEEDHGQV